MVIRLVTNNNDSNGNGDGDSDSDRKAELHRAKTIV